MDTGMRFLEWGNLADDLVAVELRGKLQAEDMHNFVAAVERIKEAGGKARVYVDLVEYDGFEAKAAAEKLGHLRTLWTGIEKVAYVVDKQWMTKAIGLFDAVAPMHLRAFGHDQRDEAKAWVMT